jgi:DNA repair exonuclease SbcCD nuclease subunit
MLLASARGLRDDIPDEQPAVLLLHFSFTEAVTPTGREVGPDFGVALPVDELEALGFDAVLMGHIHKYQRLDQPVDVGAERPILYTGSPAPVDFGEEHVEHGVVLLDVGEQTRPHHVHADFIPIESRRFLTLDYDWREAALERDPVAEDLETEKVSDAVVRVRYDVTEAGARRIDQGELRRRLYDAGAHKVFQVAATVERADRARVAGVDEELAPMSALELWLEAEALDGWERDSLRQLTSRYLEAVS